VRHETRALSCARLSCRTSLAIDCTECFAFAQLKTDPVSTDASVHT
jgi:hypothetical protein